MPRDSSRLQKELREIAADPKSGVTARVKDESDFSKLEGTIQGPSWTPYQGGTFHLDIKVNDQYPFEPPKMHFTTRVWHPNISSQSGAICLDILKDQWSPALTLKTALLSIQALLSAPQPDDPQDAVVARQYIHEYEQFKATAEEWTSQYAQQSEEEKIRQEELSPEVQHLASMGFDTTAARKALSRCNWDKERAVEIILSEQQE